VTPNIGLFCAVGVMFKSDSIMNLIKQSFGGASIIIRTY
jgi:hypothetical protein